MLMDMSGQEERVNGSCMVGLLRKQPFSWLATFEPVLGKDIQCVFRKGSESFLSVFGMQDMDFHVGTIDIFIAKMTDFANPESGRLHESNHGFLFNIRNGIYKFKGLGL